MENKKVQILPIKAEEFLYDYINKLKIKNPQVTITPGSVRGDNYLSVISKIEVKSEDCVYHWIIKSAVQQEMFRSIVPINQVYHREAFIYEKILPEFNRLQEEKGVKKPFKSQAKYVASCLVEQNECVIMEDEKHLGYKLQDRMKPLDYNHVSLLMQEYGRLHALSFALRDQKPELFQKITEDLNEVFITNRVLTNENFAKTLNIQSERVLNALDPIADKSAYEKYQSFKGRMVKTLTEAVKSEKSGKYSVVCHGDCWINNLLFKYGNPNTPNSPTDLCIIDWQLSRLGSPALDLSYFLFTCTDKQFRDKYYDEMINEYYSALSAFLIELGSDPQKLFPFSVLKEHLETFSVFGLYMSCWVLYLALSDNSEALDTHNFKNENDRLEKHNQKIRNIDKYNSRVRDIVIDFDQRGYYF